MGPATSGQASAASVPTQNTRIALRPLPNVATAAHVATATGRTDHHSRRELAAVPCRIGKAAVAYRDRLWRIVGPLAYGRCWPVRCCC